MILGQLNVTENDLHCIIYGIDDHYCFQRHTACAGPECFDIADPTLTTFQLFVCVCVCVCFLLFFFWFLFFLGERGDPSKYHYKRTIIGPSAKRHLNDVWLACR